MTDRDPEDIQRIFTAALVIPFSQLDEWLAQQCGGDEALLTEVRGLLKHDQQPNGAYDKCAHEGLLDAEQLLRKEERGLHVRCPHCHHPIELVGNGDSSDVVCDSCGSSINLTGGDETGR